MIARRVGEVLLQSQIQFRGLDGGMAERHLYLFELRPALVRQPSIRAPKIVGCEIRQSKLSGIFPQYRPDAFPGQEFMGDPSASINWPTLSIARAFSFCH